MFIICTLAQRSSVWIWASHFVNQHFKFFSICDSLLNSILYLSENRSENSNCQLNRQCSQSFLNSTRAALLLGDVSSFASKSRPSLSSWCAPFALSYYKLVSHSVSWFPVSFSLSPGLRLYLELPLQAQDPLEVTHFLIYLDFFSFTSALSAWIEVATVPLPWGLVSMFFSFLQRWQHFSVIPILAPVSPSHDFVSLSSLEYSFTNVFCLPVTWKFIILWSSNAVMPERMLLTSSSIREPWNIAETSVSSSVNWT